MTQLFLVFFTDVLFWKLYTKCAVRH